MKNMGVKKYRMLQRASWFQNINVRKTKRLEGNVITDTVLRQSEILTIFLKQRQSQKIF